MVNLVLFLACVSQLACIVAMFYIYKKYVRMEKEYWFYRKAWEIKIELEKINKEANNVKRISLPVRQSSN